MSLTCIFFGIVPMVIYAMIVWRLDRWEKEPVSLLIAGRSRWKIRSCDFESKPVKFLQWHHPKLSCLLRTNRSNTGASSSHRRNDGHPVCESSTANSNFVAARHAAAGAID